MRIFVLAMALLLACVAWAENDDQRAVAYLKGLELKQLPALELALDDTFNVFDGLLQKHSISTASGFAQSLGRSPAVATVITAQDIEAMGARTLDEALHAVPGLHVSYSYAGYMPIYVFRGIFNPANPEVLILVNDLPAKRPGSASPGPSWVHVPVRNISRIEVIRGPGSALYGADAFAGIINIITKDGQEIDGSEAGLRAGAFDTQDVWLLHGGTYGEVDFAFSFDYYRGDGFETPPEWRESGTPEIIDLHGRGFSLRTDLAYRNWKMRAAYHDRGNLGFGPTSLDPDSYLAESRLDLDLSYVNRDWRPDWEIRLQAGIQENHFESFTKMVHPAYTPLYPDGIIADMGMKEHVQRLEAVGLYSGGARHLLRLGVGLAFMDMHEVTYRTNLGLDGSGQMIPPGSPVLDLTDTPRAWLPEKRRDNLYIFLQDTWRLGENWELTTGLRYDHYSDLDNSFNPRLALIWQTSPRLTSKFLYGRAFRLPSYRDLYITNNQFMGGNPDLRAETIGTSELAWEWQANRDLHLAFNLFYFRIKDKIDFFNDENDVATTYNQKGWDGHGAEFELRWKPSPRAALLFNYAWANTRNRETDESVEIYPRHQAYLRHDWLLYPGWYLDTQLRWTADRQVASTTRSDSAAAPDYWLADLSLRYKPSSRNRWDIAIGVRNLFDKDAYEREILPLPGRHLFVEGHWRF